MLDYPGAMLRTSRASHTCWVMKYVSIHADGVFKRTHWHGQRKEWFRINGLYQRQRFEDFNEMPSLIDEATTLMPRICRWNQYYIANILLRLYSTVLHFYDN
jgi:hypothetical protein